jgi:hypothetical protein
VTTRLASTATVASQRVVPAVVTDRVRKLLRILHELPWLFLWSLGHRKQPQSWFSRPRPARGRHSMEGTDASEEVANRE